MNITLYTEGHLRVEQYFVYSKYICMNRVRISEMSHLYKLILQSMRDMQEEQL